MLVPFDEEAGDYRGRGTNPVQDKAASTTRRVGSPSHLEDLRVEDTRKRRLAVSHPDHTEVAKRARTDTLSQGDQNSSSSRKGNVHMSMRGYVMLTGIVPGPSISTSTPEKDFQLSPVVRMRDLLAKYDNDVSARARQTPIVNDSGVTENMDVDKIVERDRAEFQGIALAITAFEDYCK